MTLPFGIAQLRYLPKEVHLLNGLILFIFLNRIRFQSSRFLESSGYCPCDVSTFVQKASNHESQLPGS